MLPPSTQTKLYGNQLSAHCRAVHAFLLAANVPFQFVAVTSAEEMLTPFDDLKITDRPVFAPVLVVHGQVLSGAYVFHFLVAAYLGPFLRVVCGLWLMCVGVFWRTYRSTDLRSSFHSLSL
jgi:hypothetical protein